jgi:glycosyltransferase involved in cell wall biosynthesis
MSYKDSSYPKISIVTPSYNQAGFLEKTILSVLNQNYPNLEYIIIDGSSTDNSVEIIRKYGKYLKYWVSEPDKGQSHAINKGFEYATGHVLSWLNSDDYYMPNSLHYIAEAYKDNSNAGAFIGVSQYVDKNGKPILIKPTYEVNVSSLYKWLDLYFIQPSCFFTKIAWDTCGCLDQKLHIAMDLDLWFRIAQAYSFVTLPDCLLSSSLLHKKAKTSEYKYFAIVEIAAVIMRYGGEQQARYYLEELATKLTWNEHYMNIIINNPIFKLLRPLIRRLFKSDEKWHEVNPNWLSKKK